MQAVLYQGADLEPLIRDVLLDLKPADSAEVTSSAPTETASAPSRALSGTRPPPHIRLTSAEVTELLRRADTLLHAGDFQSARLIYSELADDGSAEAALLMAWTFDPDVLRTAFIVGMTPDVETAKHWYRKAAQLGAAGAQQRFDILAAER
jgi:TPR repeat protein